MDGMHRQDIELDLHQNAAMDYSTIRAIHIACAVLSIMGFTLRGLLMLRESPLLRAPFTRVAPHVVDTGLLATAVALAWVSGQYPFERPWLTAKVLALILYIALGTIALKRGKTLRVRATAFVLALLAALYIVSVALTRSPLGVLHAI